MSTQAVLAPLFAMAVITFVLMFGMVVTRRRAVMDKKTDPKDLLTRGGKNPWPPQAAQFSDAYANTFELPLLFYVVVIIAFTTKQADIIFVVLSWVFIVFRVIQAYIHTTTNARKYRSLAFRGGALTLVIMWVYLAIRFLIA